MLASAAVSMAQSGKYLVVYYSRSGDSKAVAEAIAAKTGGSTLEIIPTVAYPPAYSDVIEVAQTEIAATDNGNYTAINTTVDNFDDYDVVFFCTPLWWSRMSTPMQAFMHNHAEKLAGKRVALAVTSASSGISAVVADAEKHLNQSIFIADALWVRSSQISNVDEIVNNWIDGMNLTTGISSVTKDNTDSSTLLYNTSGMRIDANNGQLPHGLYIVKTGNSTKKIAR